MRNEGIRAGDISKHRQIKFRFVPHPNTSLVSLFTLLHFIGYCWNRFVVRKTYLPISLQRNRKSNIVSSKRETFTIELTINEKGGGGGHPDPKIRGGNGLKNFLCHNKMALRASLWSKITGSATALYLSKHEN